MIKSEIVPPKLSQVEVTAEIFKIIRANDYMTAPNLHCLIKRELSDIPDKMIAEAYWLLWKGGA